MKKKIFFILALLCTIVQGTRAQNYDVWDGTTTTQPSYSNHAFQINTAAQMAWLMKNYTAGGFYIPYSGGSGRIWANPRLYDISINADFDMTAANWARLIGYSENNTEHYGVEGGRCRSVTCNGNGHTIKIKISDVNDNYQGLFYGIGENATVKNLHVVADIHCAKSRLVGGIAGENDGTIENCWVSGTVRSDWKEPSSAYTAKVGGIAGENNGTIQYCCVTANVQNDDADVGGIVGDNSGHTISHCTFYGTRTSAHDQDTDYAGDKGTVENCYTTFNQGEYDAASGKDLYRRAIKYPYTCTVKTEGTGTIRTWSADEYDVPGAQPSATFSLNVTSGSMHSYTIKDADGNDVALQGHADNWSSFWFVMPKRDVTATVVFWGDWPKQGEGTEASPYLISSADDWNNFAQNVKLGRSYSGSHVKLTADISVSHMAGGYLADDNYQPFSGTFDGDGHTLTINLNNQSRFAAPFKCVKDATIKNLRTAGTIDGTGNADGKLLAGLAGICFSSATITNCRSSVTLTTNFGEDAAMAGIVAGTKGGSLTIEGCVFDGTMTGSTNTRCAGISGYEYGGTTTTITNSLFAPATLTVSTTDDGYTKTFSRDPDATITGCYYTQPLGAAQGTEAIFTSQAPSNIGTETADYGMVKAYENGLYFDGKYYFAPSTSTGAGTEGDPYIIGTTGQWDTFAAYVSNGTDNYSGKFLLLAADISVSTMMGASEANSFQGTFLGNNHTLTFTQGTAGSAFGQQNCAPFRFVKGATIRDLNVAGDIYTSQKFAAGLIAYSYGTTSVTNCHVATVIYSTVSGDGTHGGIIAMPGGTLSIEGCAYTGRLLTNKGTNNCGGFVAWHNSATISISNSLYAPGGSIPEGWSAINAGATFVRDGSPTITRCYCTEPMGTAQATQALAVATDDGLGDQVQAYSTLTIYQNGALCNGTYYRPIATHSGTGTEEDPYLINDEFEWRSFAAYVNNGNNYSGKFVRLTDDITASKTVGQRDDNPFSGTFLGNNHTITANIVSTTTGTGVNEQGVAPFHYIKNATIKNLTVGGTIASASYHTAGLVGFADGTNLIEGCAVTATINVSSDYAGGIVGHGQNSTTTIRGCAFTGTINGVGGNRRNIGGIWGWSTSGTPTLEYCLEAGTYTGIASMHPMGLQSDKGTITGCYYVTPQIGTPSNVCTVSGAQQAYAYYAAPANLGAAVADGNYGYITAYQNGLLYGGSTYYVAPEAITLTDNATNDVDAINGYAANVTLQGRTLYRDGDWNTLCLPFAMNATQIAASSLAGATIKELNTETSNLNPADGTLTLNFTTAYDPTDAPSGSIVAGKPYIVKWATTGDNISNPTFPGVAISSTTPTAVEFAIDGSSDKCQFVGQYSPFSIVASGATGSDQGNVNEIIMLGSGSKLGYSQNTRTLNCFRAHFYVPADPVTGQQLARRFVMDFGNGENTTGILTVTADTSATTTGIFTLDGRRLQAEPTEKGVYIVNGKKTIIK